MAKKQAQKAPEKARVTDTFDGVRQTGGGLKKLWGGVKATTVVSLMSIGGLTIISNGCESAKDNPDRGALQNFLWNGPGRTLEDIFHKMRDGGSEGMDSVEKTYDGALKLISCNDQNGPEAPSV